MYSLPFVVVEEGPILARIYVVHNSDEELFVELELGDELMHELEHTVHELQEDRRAFVGLEKRLMNMA
jgi:hypothetical protein